MKTQSKSVYKGTLLEMKRETEKAILARIKWGNGITEGWLPKKAVASKNEPFIRIRAWFAEGSLREQKVG